MKKPRAKKQSQKPRRLWQFVAVLGAGFGALALLFGNYDKVCKFTDERLATNTCFLPAPALVITPFMENERPAPGNEHALKLVPPRFKESFAFQSGAKLTAYLSNTGDGDHALTVSRIALKLVQYEAVRIAQLDYDYGPNNLVGKGISDSLYYRVGLDGSIIRVSDVNTTDHTTKTVDASDLLGKRQISLKPKSESQVLKLELIPRKNGLYTVQLEVDWSSKGQTRQTQSQTVFLYRNES